MHLVPPHRVYPDQPAGPFGPVEVLPAGACIGAFRSKPVAPDLDPVLHCSALTVVWFQTTPHVPTGEHADFTLRGIPWDELAKDYEL
ncbi:hypothetical protein [Streptacidiphilus monticola]|uniref:Uncharacterized protein n=1 Tax=Streptacidiphilus monticola TaxID=2161674 RepID=A0ABW1GCN2_9ACTN